jgi:CheY-like chemotaxis protein
MENKKLVFIVEDSPVQQKILQVHFEETLGSYAVKTFTDPDDLFVHLKEKPFAVVLDHFFANKTNTGFHYLKELRKNYPSLPVIYYTTLNDNGMKKQVMELGAEEYIIKDSASLVRLRTALDLLHEKVSKKKGFFQRVFGK